MTLSVDIELQQGEFSLAARFACAPGVSALFGPSGAGKSSVLNVIAGLLRPARGRVAIGDEVLSDSERGVWLAPERRGFGYVFQEGRLFPHLSVRQNLRFAGWFRQSARATEAEFGHAVELLGLETLLDRRPAGLSGGERQRVAIGRALLARPRWLLLDEPLASLDAARRTEILAYLQRLRDDTRIPMIFVSHLEGEVRQLASQVIRMDEGRVVCQGGLEVLDGQPAVDIA